MGYLKATREVWVQAFWTGDDTVIEVSYHPPKMIPLPEGRRMQYIHLRKDELLGFKNMMPEQDAYQFMLTHWPDYFVLVAQDDPPNLSAG